MAPRLRGIALNLLLVALSVGIVLVGAEVFLRIFPRYLPPAARLRLLWAAQPDPSGVANPYTGYVYPASVQQRINAGDLDFAYTTDEHGFRNRSPWPDSADIVVIGDSEAFGWGVADDSTWSAQVARALPGSRIVNLALPGMAPKQYFRVYRQFGAPLHPKLVIFGLFPGNDLSDEREFDAWLDAGSPGNYATWKFNHGSKPPLAERMMEHSYLFWALRETRRGLQQRMHSVPPMTFPDGSRIQFAPSFMAREAMLATPEDPNFVQVMQAIDSTRALAQEQGAAMLVIVFPTKEDVYFPLRGDSLPPLRAPLVRAVAERGIPYLDLTIPMQEEARKQRRLFFEIDGHPDGAGYHVIAQAVLAHLREHAGDYHLSERQ